MNTEFKWAMLLFCLFSPFSFTKDLDYSPDSRLSVGVNIGTTMISSKSALDGGGSHSVNLDMAYNLAPKLSLYSSYTFINNVSTQNHKGKSDLHVIDMGLKYRYGLSPNLSIFTKVGGAYSYANNTNGYDVFRKDNVFLGLGAGISYRLNNAVTTRFGYNYYPDLKLFNEQYVGLNQFYWGLAYQFKGGNLFSE